MLRLFAALPVPFEVAEALAARQHGLAGAKWRSAEQLHITLRFFGDVSETVAADLDAALAGVRSTPFEIALRGVGAFGEGHHQRSVWAGVADSEPLRALAGRCESAAHRAGLKRETRRYRPHLTLAYLSRAADDACAGAWVAEHNLLHSPPWPATRFGLYSSWQSASGSRYELERDCRLG